MGLDTQLIADLRSLFLHGATPSRLIRHIAAQYDSETNWQRYIEPYFAEAFSVALLIDPCELDRIDFSTLNVDLVRDMVGRTDAWIDSHGDDNLTWMDGLTVAPNDLKMADKLRPEANPLIAGDWATLPPRTQEFIRRCMVNSQGYFERMQVLAKLVERLQDQIREFESVKPDGKQVETDQLVV